MLRNVSTPVSAISTPRLPGPLERLIPIDWRLDVEPGPSIRLIHDDGRQTLRFDPSDLGFPKYLEPTEADQVLQWLIPLAVADTFRIVRQDSRAQRMT